MTVRFVGHGARCRCGVISTITYRMELISEAEVDDWLQSDAVQQYIRSIHDGEVSKFFVRCLFQLCMYCVTDRVLEILFA